MRLNGFQEKDFPTLGYDDIETPELAELTGALSGLVGSGILTPDDKLEEFVREYANLPAVDSTTSREEEPDTVAMTEESIKAFGEGEENEDD